MTFLEKLQFLASEMKNEEDGELITEALNEIIRCHQRLEIDCYYTAPDQRVDVPYDQRLQQQDAIDCRDALIKILLNAVELRDAKIKTLEGK